jgi:hypothetical protein
MSLLRLQKRPSKTINFNFGELYGILILHMLPVSVQCPLMNALQCTTYLRTISPM